MDSKQGVCLFFQRTGTCKLGDKCPLSHVREERGITTKYDDRIWQHAQVVRPGKTFRRIQSTIVSSRAPVSQIEEAHQCSA